MTARRLKILLHWAQFALLLGLISARQPTAPWVTAYAFVALLWPLTALPRGLSGKPGPRLEGLARLVHPWHHRLLYLLVAASGAMCVFWLTGANIRLQYWLFLLFMVSNLHAVFHLWRHTALFDGALRLITPKALHKIL